MENKNSLLEFDFNENDVIKKYNIEIQHLEFLLKDLNEKTKKELETLYLILHYMSPCKTKIKIIIDNYKKLIMLLLKENKTEDDFINIRKYSSKLDSIPEEEEEV